MRTVVLFCGVLLMSTAVIEADTRSDVLSLTGNARAKLIWLRYPWCDSAYNPIRSYRSSDGENGHAFTQLMAFDTDEGAERYLDKDVGYHFPPRITRKDGNYVIWSDSAHNCSWIRDCAGKSAKRKLIDGGDFIVVHCRYDALTDKEYVYTLAADRKRLSMLPLNADYTVDNGARITVYTAGDMMKECLGISADGRYLGTLIPWPNTMIVDMATGTRYNRHNADDAFGCQPNLAPDNSYRFFYLRSAHLVIRMWGPALTADNWDVVINMMPGNTDFNKGGYYHDCVLPRWTNNPLFFTNSYPLVMWNYSDGRIFDYSADQLKSDQLKDSCGTGVFCLGKLTADYKAVENYVRITTCDVRKRDVVGDGWIDRTSSPVKDARLGVAEKMRFRIKRAGMIVSVSTPYDKMTTLSVVNSSGRVISQTSGIGELTFPLRSEATGVVLIRLVSEANAQTFRMPLTLQE